jgi:3-oxosteroid 1-dehydrogenase
MEMEWDRVVDVIVAGSGAAGLTAATVASDGGCTVEVLEKAALLGGTSAISGGMPWVPLNAHLSEVGVEDSRDDALIYINGLTLGRGADASVVEAFVDRAAEAIAYLEQATPVKFRASSWADYHADRPGGKLQGRSLDAQPFNLEDELGTWRGKLRVGPYMGARLTMNELAGPKWGARHVEVSEDEANLETLAGERDALGIRTMGEALVGALVRGVLDREIPVTLETRVTDLVTDHDGAVIGVRAERNGTPLTIGARSGVVLATGGFEWNAELVRAFLPVPEVMPASPSSNEGDGLLMGLRVGAALSNMTSVLPDPATYDGMAQIEGNAMPLLSTPRFEPGCIMVNRSGRRFINEALSYMEIFKVMSTYDPLTQSYPNDGPAWMVFDDEVRQRIAVSNLLPGESTPGWVKQADTLEELARLIDVPVEAFVAEVSRFNAFVAVGDDSDFGRGTQAYELNLPGAQPKVNGNPAQRNRYLAPVTTAPFYALPLHATILGTLGGLRTDGQARVLAFGGDTVPGLYAAGNVAGGIFGPAYPGGGATLGPAMTFGYIAGKHLAKRHATILAKAG